MSPSKPNLFGIAKSNAGNIQQQFERKRSSFPTNAAKALDAFISWFNGKACVSINLRIAVLTIFSRTGTYLNIHAWASAQAKLSGRANEDCLRDRLGKFYNRRMAFDRTFESGDTFVYAAVNVGNAGLAKFGSVCAVFGPKVPATPGKAAYLPGDSLICCFDASDKFSMDLLREKVGPHSHRQYLAANKLADEIVTTSQDSWASLVLSDSDYIEVVLPESPLFSSVSAIRIPRKEYDDLWDLAFANSAKKLGEAERALVSDFIHIIDKSKEGHFDLEIVA